MMTKTLVWTQFAMKEGLAPKPPEFYVNEGDRLELYVATKAKTEPPAWDGEGLPPVGARGVDGDGDIVEVVAHHHGHAVCYLVDYADHQYIDVEYSQFRPIRSEEERRVDEMIASAGLNYDIHRTTCHALYRAGYRKQEVGDGL